MKHSFSTVLLLLTLALGTLFQYYSLGILCRCVGAWNVLGQDCDCIDVLPPSGRSCAESRDRGECSRRWMQRGNYCAETCSFCQCVAEEVDACATCDDIPPDGVYTCDEQKAFDKCSEPWMKPFCRRTCGRCDCAFDEDVSFAFGAISSNSRPRTVTTPLTEVLLNEDDESCPTSVVEVFSDAPQFTLMNEILKTVGLDATLTDRNISLTVLAPVNEAFADMAEAFGMTLAAFLETHPDKVREIMEYHVIPFAIKSDADLGNTFSFKTLVPDKRLFGASSVEIDGIGSSATVIQSGVRICRSVVVTIDEVLLPGTTLDDIGPVVENVPEPTEEIPKCDPRSDVMMTLAEDPELSAFLQALEDSEVGRKLGDRDLNFTVFAPTNAAFEIALAELGLTYKQLLRDKKTLKALLNYHIVAKNLESENLSDRVVRSVNGEKLVIAVERDAIEIAGVGSSANVLEADIDNVCTSAVHKIDTTLLPFDIGNEIWAAVGTGEPRAAPKESEEAPCIPIARVLAQNKNLRVLNDVARGAGLIPELADEQAAVTLFAPTDAAFFSVFLDPDTGMLSPLLTDPEILKSLFAYHTHQTPLTFKSLRPGKKLPTQLDIEGARAKLGVVKKRLSPLGIVMKGELGDEAAIIEKNIVACNSVIHLVDSVLLPFVVEEEPITVNPSRF